MKPHYLHNNMRELLHSRKRSSNNTSNNNVHNNKHNSSFAVPRSNSGRVQVVQYQHDNLFLRQQQQQQQQQQQSQRRHQHPRQQLQQRHHQHQHQQQQQRRQQQQSGGRPPQQPSRQQHSSRGSSMRMRGGRSSNSNLPSSNGSSRVGGSASHQSSSRLSHPRSSPQQQSPHNNTTSMTSTTATNTSATAAATPVTVPNYIPASVSRCMSDDETSWISGVESHTNGGGASTSSARNPYLRDGRTTKRVIDDLNQAEDPESILTALSIVCVEFDHAETIKHNAELYYGAISVLTQKLTTVDPTNHDALRMICAALEMALRGGSKYVKEAFHVNAPTMMPPLLALLEKCEQSKVRFADEIILNITKSFYYLSRLSELRVPLARCQLQQAEAGLGSSFLDCLQRVATTPLNVPCRNVRVRIMANLANCEDNKVLLFAHKGLLTSLLKISHLDSVDVTREYAIIALMDLASASANQISLAKSGQVLRVLTAMVVSEKVTAIREHVTTILQNLAFPKSNRKRLVEFHNGVVIEALLQQLLHDTNEKARRRAAGAMTNLACDETAERMAVHPNLLTTLAEISTQDDNEEVQARACLALTKIASSTSVQSPYHAAIMDALVVATQTEVDNNIAAVFRLRAREAACRESMARHPGILTALSEMCTKPTASLKDRDNATRALMHLANENVNRKIMCNDKVLDAFVGGASCGYSIAAARRASLQSTTRADTDDTDDEHLMTEIQDSAIRAIARLATEVSNRKTMAKHKGLITAIAKATELESKLELQQAGMNSTEQPQSFLGKPLLMSLLIAL